MNNKEIIWNYFLNKDFTPQGIAGIMGNIQHESKFMSNNVENRAPYTDEQYTLMVNNKSYNNFVNDGFGYGLVQWTYGPFKQDLLNICKLNNKPIDDIYCQLDLLYSHLQSEKLLNILKNASSINEAAIIFMTKFEKPKDQSQEAKQIRIDNAINIYNEFSKKQGGKGKMKYSNSNPPIVCMQTNSTCYKGTSKMSVKGVLWHSTGANNTTIKRYVQPSDNDPNKAALLKKIGTNTARNDWNHVSTSAGLNAWIGTIADGSVAAVQTMPWDYKPWGCGSGSRGSCNNGWIQFEICEDSLTSKNYFDKIYREACELTAYLCSLYNINPNGTVNFNGIQVPTILCHQDSAQLGLGSNHADVLHWFSRYGKTMADVRKDVSTLLGNKTITPTSQPVVTTSSTNRTRILKKGLDGDDVKELQEKLIKLGYNIVADGDFGNNTLSAVLKFQKEHGLVEDGEVGPTTMTAINNALKNPVKTTSTSTSTDEVYRIRLSWNNPGSQVGAYRHLENAKKAVDKLGGGYGVYNSKGERLYPNTSSTSKSSILQPTVSKYSGVVIGSSSKDENGQYRGGRAGDQTNKEVYILNWYDGGWNKVIRPKTNSLAEKIAVACEQACNNNNVGYDQYERNSLYIQAKKVGLDISKITTPCECDCASLVSTCCICAGLPADIFYAGNNMRITGNLAAACEKTGEFNILTSTNYTKSKDYLKRGDILLADGHTVIVLSNGSKAEQIATIVTTIETYKVRVTTPKLNVRSGPGQSYAIVTQVRENGVFTIIEERSGYGKLKSGAGWIDLSYTKRV